MYRRHQPTRRARAARLLLEKLEDRTLLDCTAVLSGKQVFDTLTIPAGETWCFDPKVSTTVESAGNVVVYGTLVMQPADPSVLHTLRFTGANEAAFVGGGDVVRETDVGLWVMAAGRLDIAGTPKLGWARATDSLAQGATEVTLDADPAGWQVGDEVVVTPTNSGSDSYLEFDVRTIAAISGRTVTFSSGTTYAHPAVTVSPGQTFAAEVLNLSRNVNLEGMPPTYEFPQAGQNNDPGRAHVFIHNTVPTVQVIAHAAIRYMGPRKYNAAAMRSDAVLGRYGLHIHRSFANNYGSLVEGVVVRDTGGHAFAPHTSHGVTFRDTISYNTADHAYWWDLNDATNDTLWEHAVAALVKVDPRFQGGHDPLAGFTLGRGTGNTVRDAVAVGVQASDMPVESSGFGWPTTSITGVWNFEGNLAHNNKKIGIFVWQNTRSPHVVSSSVAYHNGTAGLDNFIYPNEYVFDQLTLYGNARDGLAEVKVRTNGLAGGAEGAMMFRDVTIDAAGSAANALLIEVAGQSRSLTPTRFIRWTVTGYTDRAVTVQTRSLGLYDFSCWTVGEGNELEPEDFNLVVMAPGSLIRVQRWDGTAYQIDSNYEVTPIDPFTTCDRAGPSGALSGGGAGGAPGFLVQTLSAAPGLPWEGQPTVVAAEALFADGYAVRPGEADQRLAVVEAVPPVPRFGRGDRRSAWSGEAETADVLAALFRDWPSS